MYKQTDNDNNWFYVENGRAMVSLGPLSSKKTCPYNCAFCYVQDGFDPYVSKSNKEIVDFLIRHRNQYNIIYVSGDTDSFAAPRTKQGVELLYNISKHVDCDLLFTTRAIISNNDLLKIKDAVDNLKRNNKKLYACVSITRYSDEVQYLEPSPIPSPEKRIKMLEAYKKIGAVTVLAMRPFLPIVTIEDYYKILDKSKDWVDIVLGEQFFFVEGGKIEKRIFINGIPEQVKKNLIHNQNMNFNSNNKKWIVWHSQDLEEKIKKRCDEYNLIFSMHSSDAIDLYNSCVG